MFRIYHLNHGSNSEPCCALVRVSLNSDGSVAAVSDPVFSGVDPGEVLYDLAQAFHEAGAAPVLLPSEVCGFDTDQTF